MPSFVEQEIATGVELPVVPTGTQPSFTIKNLNNIEAVAIVSRSATGTLSVAKALSGYFPTSSGVVEDESSGNPSRAGSIPPRIARCECAGSARA